jgi:hypothetical protein
MSTQQDFLVGELWMLAWAASVQRAKLYKAGYHNGPKVISPNGEQLSDHLFQYLVSEVVPKYKQAVEEEEHYRHIDSLIVHANSIGSQVLGEHGYKYGVAQKLLNLFLYLWCLGEIAEPPHCPVDRIIISKTRYKDDRNWTDIIRRLEYEEVIEEIRRLARREATSIARWELVAYGRR